MTVDATRAAEQFQTVFTGLEDNLKKVIVGHHRVIREVLVTLFSGGHALLEGVPGTGKTLLVKTLARSVDLSFGRIQFTPDLMPADVIGTFILDVDDSGRREFRFEQGPIFNQVILADEVNRATPKTQSALLEAMAEQSVTLSGESHPLEEPFMVLATQNPIEMEGTYPLPEAQLDRFLMKIHISTEGVDQLVGILDRTTGEKTPEVSIVGDRQSVIAMRQLARQVVLSDPLKHFIARLVMATHPGEKDAPPKVKRFVRFGASPRGAQSISLASKVMALIRNRLHVAEEDIRDVAFSTLRHRLVLNFEGEAEGLAGDDILEEVMETVGV
jgi:MoxR-like ATPase